MKVLWLGGIILPKIAEKEKLEMTHANGWLIKLSEMLGMKDDIELVYVFDSNKSINGSNEFYKYYGIKCDKTSYKRFGEDYISEAMKILNIEKPDVVHIWGSEGSHTLGMVEACEKFGILDSTIISIQGLVSKYAKHYCSNLPNKVIHGVTIKDIIQGNSIKKKKVFEERGKLEEEAIKKVKHVIGRTEWDKASTWDINPFVNYHFNNETLREEFYNDSWDYEECEKYSIFCSQAYNPIKGIHMMINALPRIKEEYPEVKLYIGGKDYTKIPKWKRNSYERYILKLIKKYKLDNNVIFTGYLNAVEMKNRYLKSNVFVSPSAIENSPNSVGEAMILGVPVVSSRVGGVHNILNHGEEGYTYPFNEDYMLSYYVCEIFGNPTNAKRISKKAQIHAKFTHNSMKNLNELLEIYKNISIK